ncbi:O-antigen ligase family protein [Pseudomonas mosselii]|uniref:O-antigen ligase family protein n=1 Tax=Pseudomonas mosselii TaxID=78327 RepID=UPI0021633015|nr:O-antigen ligase family protein [Pseudomonas mosselii]UVN45744.1 O-antigen ligase family protein [Pseudomonas mosselii]
MTHFIAAILLCIPLRIFVPSLGVEVAPADILCLLAVPFLLIYARKINTWLLSCILLSIFSLATIQLLYQPGNLDRAILSIAFFFKPYLAFMLGRQQGFTQLKPEKFNSTLIVLLTITAVIATFDAFLFKGTIATFEEFERIPGEVILGGVFAPTFLGIKFHGSNGVNGIAVFFAFSFMVILALGVIFKPQKKLVVISCIGLLCSAILVLGSGSRQAVFGILLCFFCYLTAGRMTTNRVIWLFLAIIFSALTATVILVYFSDYFLELFAKTGIMLDNITSGDWDGVTSGRIGLYIILADDLIHSPIFGTGFSGYGIFDSHMDYFTNDVSTSGYTPHNQYLGALWKMGFLPGIFYLAFLWSITYPHFRAPQTTATQRHTYIAMASLIIPFFSVFNVFQDGLSSPSTGPFMLYILGYYSSWLDRTNSAA